MILFMCNLSALDNSFIFLNMFTLLKLTVSGPILINSVSCHNNVKIVGICNN